MPVHIHLLISKRSQVNRGLEHHLVFRLPGLRPPLKCTSTGSINAANSARYSSIASGDEIPRNYQRTLRPLYRLNFSSQVITGISSHKAWAMI
jgi:hypothetical protein